MVEDDRRSLQGAVFVLATISQPAARIRLGEVPGLDLCATNMKLEVRKQLSECFRIQAHDCVCLRSHCRDMICRSA